MKVSKNNITEQMKPIEMGMKGLNTKFLNQIINGLQRKVADAIPKELVVKDGLVLEPMGKNISVKITTLTLMGQVTLNDAAAMESIDDKIRLLMDSLKNPSDFLSMLQE